MPVAFIDSGIGGIPYVLTARDYLPHQQFVYVADTALFPYGDRTAESIVQSVIRISSTLLDTFAPRVIVIACNTASVFALPVLRDRFDVPFVGTVPAVKPAAELSKSGNIAVLATSRTVGAAYLDQLVETYARECIIERIAGSELVSFVEQGGWRASVEEIRSAIMPTVEMLQTSRIDTLVLACTHFIFLKEQFESLLGPDVTVVDSRDGVARRIRTLVSDSEESAAGQTGARADTLLCTSLDTRYEALSNHFGFDYSGILTNEAPL